jgi:hypothetical protein
MWLVQAVNWLGTAWAALRTARSHISVAPTSDEQIGGGPGACERWPLATSRGLSGSSVSRKPSYPFLEINILITIPPHRYADTGERA